MAGPPLPPPIWGRPLHDVETGSRAPAAVHVFGLRFRYPGSDHDVLRVPLLEVWGSGLTAITGPSGAGKSTLVELIAGTIREPYAGEISVLGVDLGSLRRDADRQRHLRRIGLIPQDFGLLPDRTVSRILDQDLTDAGVPRPEHERRITEALEQVGLAAFAERPAAMLSGGQRQRVAIARMLARDVELVIADEPTANLDPALVDGMVGLFRDLATTRPVIIVTHDAAVAALCDRTIVLDSPSGAGTAATRLFGRRRWPLVIAGAAVCIAATGVGVVALHGRFGGIAQPATNVAASNKPSAPDSPAASVRAAPTPVPSTVPTRPPTAQTTVSSTVPPVIDGFVAPQQIPGMSSPAGPSLAAYGSELYAAYRGNDYGFYWSTYNGSSWSPSQKVPGQGAGSTPALAVYDGELYAGFRATTADSLLWDSFNGTNWGSDEGIPNAESNWGPSLASFSGDLYAAWKGVGSDTGIYWSAFNGSNWTPAQEIPGVATGTQPSLAVYEGHLYAAWKSDNDDSIWWSSFNGSTWGSQQQIPGGGTSSATTLAAFGSNLYAAWSTTNGAGIYWSAFNGTSWSPSQAVPGVGSSNEPALAVYAGNLYGAWDGSNGDDNVYWSSTTLSR